MTTSSPGWRRVGLLGGTFDPPHLGHLIAAEAARVELELDEVRFVVAGAPWMKHSYTSAAERVAMTQLAVEDDDAFTVNADEVGRSGPTFTVDTLEAMARDEPNVDITFLLGADAASQIGEWHEPQRCLELATFVVLPRPGWPLDLAGPLLGRMTWLDMPLVGISSTDLRARFSEGRAVRHQVPRQVEEYVHEHGLYARGTG